MKELIYTHFPYCIKCVGKNEYIVLNRNYKPLGINTWVDDYSVHPSVIIREQPSVVFGKHFKVHGFRIEGHQCQGFKACKASEGIFI